MCVCMDDNICTYCCYHVRVIAIMTATVLIAIMMFFVWSLVQAILTTVIKVVRLIMCCLKSFQSGH